MRNSIARSFEQDGGVAPDSIGRLYEGDLAQDKAAQRATGSFYTPEYLVDFVVQRTLAPLIETMRMSGAQPGIEQIGRLRILDPSCGGGAFLLGVLRFLEAQCERAGQKVGPALRSRICSECLVGVDLDPNAVAVTEAALRMAIAGTEEEGTEYEAVSLELLVGDALLPETEFARVDAIVGNPPWGQKGVRLSAESKKRYKELFSTAVGVWDPFKLFVERCHQLLKEGGRWGLVLPDIVLLKKMQEVRDVILNLSRMDTIAHCGKAFRGANIDAVAIVGECGPRNKERQTPEVCTWTHLAKDWQNHPEPDCILNQETFLSFPGHVFNLYLHGAALGLYQRVGKCPRLGSLYEMHEGVHTGNSRKKLFVAEKLHSSCSPVIVGRKEFRPYQLEWAGTWLDHSEGLLDRNAGEYANLGRPQWHGAGKIVVRRTGDRVMAAHDSEGVYVSNNLFVLQGQVPQSQEQSQAMVALLNSRFMTWYFRAVVPRKGRLFAELKLVQLRDFPMPTFENWQGVQQELSALAKRGQALGHKKVQAEVDVLVERAFEISQRELEVIKLAT